MAKWRVNNRAKIREYSQTYNNAHPDMGRMRGVLRRAAIAADPVKAEAERERRRERRQRALRRKSKAPKAPKFIKLRSQGTIVDWTRPLA
jgi:hypothetical protein